MRKVVYLLLPLFSILLSCNDNVYYISEFGLTPNSGVDATPYVAEAIATIVKENGGEPAILYFDEGDYDFYPQNANERELYISNHDQLNPKKIAVILEGISNLTIDGQGANFYMNGRMLPMVMDSCSNCVIKNISIDMRVPQITQITIVENNIEEGFIIYRLFPGTNYKIDDAKRLITYGDGWEIHPIVGIAFDGNTHHIIYQTSDIAVGTENVEELEPYLIKAPWRNQKLKNGDIVVLRNYERPTPGIFVNSCRNLILNDVNIHYAEGMGLLAQLSENITLKGFCVSIRKGSNRYFTTQADATHFSACKGDIISVNGMYEGMMDDAINVHGTYLKILERLDSKRVIASYMHPQTYGFYWGGSGDSVQFVKSSTMEIISENVIENIKPYDRECVKGAKLFEIQFKDTLMAEIDNSGYGIENLEWTPSVYFADNTIRNNRARGALFSTPKDVTVERNLFDHTSGTAILLCGDCNGWFETGACRKVIICNNHFVNALTNMFQFTNAIISIYPEIPDLKSQKKYFHGGEGRGVVIEKNTFETFDSPIVYAKSLDGMIFRDNTIIDNNDYEPFHWNKHRFLFDRVINVSIENNNFMSGFDETKDVCYGN
ncbi:MAG: alpha-1,3-galactosidase B [Bacteroidales bacterium]|nr:alpha-1,3-galactosidase B [Bacteroidales bacterium]